MVDGDVEVAVRQAPIWRAVSRSLRALTSHARTSSPLASSIDSASALENLRFEGSADSAEALELCPGFHQNVLGQAQPAKRAVRPLSAANRWLIAFTNDYQEVQVAALIRFTPCVRAEYPNLIELELCRESAGDFFEQALTDALHGLDSNTMGGASTWPAALRRRRARGSRSGS